MNERERIIHLWFDMWLKQQDLGIDSIFTEDVIYTESGFEVLKAGTQTVGKDYPRPGFLMGTAIKCYAVERHF